MSTEQIIESVMSLEPEGLKAVKAAIEEREVEIAAAEISEKRFQEMEMGLNVMSEEEFNARMEGLKARLNANR